ncbi:DUF2634 domain-containing protein [Paenibacillus sepulcri]|uniref:DUF2634 domain-containing protein n=1 Tax=Paenibacillus sepulcri TaxID=359917 RepID=A0ABS7CBT3_9BACL|nr:DUF2634 domain-containing protein [Paenibacillus sepulcri]
MIIPAGGQITDAQLEEIARPSYTYKLDLRTQRVSGMVDGLEAVKQAVFKILQTVRYRHVIYSFDYGHELESLIGTNPLFVEAEVRRMLEEALLQDNRIREITDLKVEITGDSIAAVFNVMTDTGSFEFMGEVTARV